MPFSLVSRYVELPTRGTYRTRPDDPVARLCAADPSGVSGAGGDQTGEGQEGRNEEVHVTNEERN